jgi:hypothetical protein
MVCIELLYRELARATLIEQSLEAGQVKATGGREQMRLRRRNRRQREMVRRRLLAHTQGLANRVRRSRGLRSSLSGRWRLALVSAYVGALLPWQWTADVRAIPAHHVSVIPTPLRGNECIAKFLTRPQGSRER